MYYISYKYGPRVLPVKSGEDPRYVYDEYPFDVMIEYLELDLAYFEDTIETTESFRKHKVIKHTETKAGRIVRFKAALELLKEGEQLFSVFGQRISRRMDKLYGK